MSGYGADREGWHEAIAGTFPDYERVIPKTNTKIMTVKTNDFASSIDRVATISSDKSKAVKFVLENNSLTLTVTNPDAGIAVEKVDVTYESDDLEVGFNINYLIDVLNSLEEEMVKFEFYGEDSSCVVKEPNSESEVYVIMPMRL